MNEWLARALGAGELRPIAHLPGSPEGFGVGRIIDLANPATLTELLPVIKQHLGIHQVRMAMAPRHRAGEPITRAAVCAGAGGSVFEQCRERVDLLLTGEMRHHDILYRVETGTSVIVTDHSNSERGYLPKLAQRLQQHFGGELALHVASADGDPLTIT